MEEKREFFVQAGKLEDEDDLLDELNEMEAEMAGKELEELEIGAGHVQAKEQPMHVGAGAAKARSEEDELNEL